MVARNILQFVTIRIATKQLKAGIIRFILCLPHGEVYVSFFLNNILTVNYNKSSRL